MRKSSSTCQRAGNCRHWKHRQDRRCSNKWLVEGSDYCATCVCDVQGCVKPKAKSPDCRLYGNIFNAAPLPVQLAVLAEDLAPLLVPCDITDFLSIYPEIKSDLAVCILCALVKEPTATRMIVEQWRKLPATYDAAGLNPRIGGRGAGLCFDARR